MSMSGDAADMRVPVVFASAETATADDALLIEGDGGAPSGDALVVRWFRAGDAPRRELRGHRIGCPCCEPRGAMTRLLGELFAARARGEIGFFRRVVVVTRDPATVPLLRDTLAADRVVAARYRLAGGPRALPGSARPGSAHPGSAHP